MHTPTDRQNRRAGGQTDRQTDLEDFFLARAFDTCRGVDLSLCLELVCCGGVTWVGTKAEIEAKDGNVSEPPNS